jgi:hypothetical protein
LNVALDWTDDLHPKSLTENASSIFSLNMMIFFVMAGHSRPKDGVARLCPAIHVFLKCGQDVDTRHKAGHDELR